MMADGRKLSEMVAASIISAETGDRSAVATAGAALSETQREREREREREFSSTAPVLHVHAMAIDRSATKIALQ